MFDLCLGGLSCVVPSCRELKIARPLRPRRFKSGPEHHPIIKTMASCSLGNGEGAGLKSKPLVKLDAWTN